MTITQEEILKKGEEVRAGEGAAVDAGVARVNKEAGYDVPLAYAVLNAVTIQEQGGQTMPRFECQCDLTAAVDVVVRWMGGTLNDKGLALLINFAVAYGWHYAKEGESLVRSEAVREKMYAFVEGSGKVPAGEKGSRREAIEKGCEALVGAVERATERLKMVKAVRG